MKNKTFFDIINDITNKFKNKEQKRHLWNYITALRGPDVNEYNNNTLKMLLSCPLRGTGNEVQFMSVDTFFTRIVNYSSRALLEVLLSNDSVHFINHIISAWETLYETYPEKRKYIYEIIHFLNLVRSKGISIISVENYIFNIKKIYE